MICSNKIGVSQYEVEDCPTPPSPLHTGVPSPSSSSYDWQENRGQVILTSDQVSAAMGLSKETLAQWRSQKRGIPYLKIGRAVRYDPVGEAVNLEWKNVHLEPATGAKYGYLCVMDGKTRNAPQRESVTH